MQESPPSPSAAAPATGYDQGDVHNKLGQLTRQLHNALRELGYAERLRHSVEELPDAQNRLSYIARLTGQAAEKVLTLVDDAKDRQTTIVSETKRMRQAMIHDPVAAVAKGHIMNYLEEMEKSTEIVDQQLTDIMMAQDFHDLTGQVIAKVVNLAAGLEQQLVDLLLQTAPSSPAVGGTAVVSTTASPIPEASREASVAADEADDLWAAALAESQSGEEQGDAASSAAGATESKGVNPDHHPSLSGPAVNPDDAGVVASQSEVDDLLASLGF